MIDLRSDTVTRPDKGMLDRMINARVGDDVFGDDPTVKELEKHLSDLFGTEAGLLCPSGTMANQIAILVHTSPGDEIICDKTAHVYNYEGGGIGLNAGCSVRLLDGDKGIFSNEDVISAINIDDIHYPKSKLVVIENTSNKGGGSCWSLEQIRSIYSTSKAAGLDVHMDGARVFNAIVAKGYQAGEIGSLVDSISICLSKGLGAPVGSVLLGDAAFIKEARRKRKVLGGGMRQAGFLAAAGLYALEHNVSRLVEDHLRSCQMAEVLVNQAYIESVIPPETNILIFKLHQDYKVKEVLEIYRSQGLYAVPFGPHEIRFVYHKDVSQSMHEEAMSIVKTSIPS